MKQQKKPLNNFLNKTKKIKNEKEKPNRNFYTYVSC